MDYNIESSAYQRSSQGGQSSGQSGGPRRNPAGGNASQAETVTISGGSKRKEWSQEEISKYLEDYIEITPDMWINIPEGAQVAWINKGNEPVTERFTMGGYVVKNYFFKKENKRVFTVRSFSKNSFTMDVNVDKLAKMYKRYDKNSYIEFRLVQSSLLQKRIQIDALQAELAALKATVAELKAEMTALARKK